MKHPYLRISREKAALLGREMVEILQAGYYISVSGKRIDIRKPLEGAVNGTVSYPPDTNLPERSHSQGKMIIEVHNQTTLAGVEYLRSKGFDPVLLNFASATSPGGGFLSGARAQEEYLARSSGL
jgi:uncharacterized protein (TIGR02452 family)